MAKNAKKALASAAHVDLDRFVGSWFEVARLPDPQERNCVADARVTYARTDDGLRMLSLCRREDGTIRRSTGRAKLADDATQARFKISYSHSALDALPFVWSDYTIIDVADDYSTAIVGAADRKHLWFLSRQPTVASTAHQDFMNKARAQGFDTSATYLYRTRPRRRRDWKQKLLKEVSKCHYSSAALVGVTYSSRVRS